MGFSNTVLAQARKHAVVPRGTQRAALWNGPDYRFTKWILWNTVIAVWDALLQYEGFNGELRAVLTFKYPMHSKAALGDFTPIIY